MAKLLALVLVSLYATIIQLACCIDGQAKVYAPTIELANGKVRGLVEDVNGKEVHVYQGIRFGEYWFVFFQKNTKIHFFNFYR